MYVYLSVLFFVSASVFGKETNNGTVVVVVKKCCPEGRIFDYGKCVGEKNIFEKPQVYSWPGIKPLEKSDIEIIYGFPHCKRYTYFLDPAEDSSEEFALLETGWLWRANGRSHSPKTFCFDTIASKKAVRPVVCFPVDEKPEDAEAKGTFVVYPLGMLVSIPFLVITFIVYFCNQELSNFHGRCLLCHVASLVFSYSCLIYIQIASHSLNTESCIALGFAVQFFFLATFFWLNVMCFDIYWAFSGMRLLRGSASERERKKLLLYSLYAWGMPLLILSTTVFIDFTDVVSDNSQFKPGIGKDRCLFRGIVAEWIYFYGPMAVILFTNCILFGITAFRLYKHRKETAVLNRGDSRKHDGNDNERFNLYLKLFLVMGINWMAELISFIFGKQVPKYLWYVTDISNTLQGVFIFLIFVWKKRVRLLLWNKLCKGKSWKGKGSGRTSGRDKPEAPAKDEQPFEKDP